MLLPLGCVLLILGLSYDIGQNILRTLYPSIPNFYRDLPLIDGPQVRKDKDSEDSLSRSSSRSIFFEE